MRAAVLWLTAFVMLLQPLVLAAGNCVCAQVNWASSVNWPSSTCNRADDVTTKTTDPAKSCCGKELTADIGLGDTGIGDTGIPKTIEDLRVIVDRQSTGDESVDVPQSVGKVNQVCCCDPSRSVCNCVDCHCEVESSLPANQPIFPPTKTTTLETQITIACMTYPVGDLSSAVFLQEPSPGVPSVISLRTAPQTCAILSRFRR